MDLAALDDLLVKAEHDAAAMAGNLLALEETPAFTLIKHTTFTGATHARFGAALAGLDGMWERAATFSGTVAEARRLRDEHRHPSHARMLELERLLTSPGLPAADANGGSGLTGRTIFGSANGVTLAAIATELDQSYRALADAVRTIDAAWQAQLPTLQTLAEQLRRAADDGVALGLDMAHELRDLPAEVHRALTEATTDPVGHASRTSQMHAEVTAVRDRLSLLATQRDRLPLDLAAARQELVSLRLLATRGARAAERAVAKVREPAGLCPPIEPDRLDAAAPTGLGPELDRIEHLDLGWLAQRSALDGWVGRARELRARCEAVVRANEAPVAARDELRGRLESYRAMAGAHGAAEDAALTDLFERAHDALHTAPSDLRVAAPLVVQYVVAVRARAQGPSAELRQGDTER